jgi:hypothetical protein
MRVILPRLVDRTPDGGVATTVKKLGDSAVKMTIQRNCEDGQFNIMWLMALELSH